jgi:hypothetical protein
MAVVMYCPDFCGFLAEKYTTASGNPNSAINTKKDGHIWMAANSPRPSGSNSRAETGPVINPIKANIMFVPIVKDTWELNDWVVEARSQSNFIFDAIRPMCIYIYGITNLLLARFRFWFRKGIY